MEIRKGNYIYDIFNSNGIYFLKKGLGIFFNEGGVHAKIKNKHMYCIEEKESGFKKLVIYRVSWG